MTENTRLEEKFQLQCSFQIFYIRVVHVDPVQLDVQEQVFGAVHAPPFEHDGEQTDKREISIRIFF